MLLTAAKFYDHDHVITVFVQLYSFFGFSSSSFFLQSKYITLTKYTGAQRCVCVLVCVFVCVYAIFIQAYLALSGKKTQRTSRVEQGWFATGKER